MVKRRIPNEIIREVDDFVGSLKKDKFPISAVYLFGSYAKGKQHKWSDIDLCIISSKFNDPFRALEFLWKKRIKDNGLTIEPVGFSVKDFASGRSSLIEEIKRTGIRIG